jgi:eukaryotic translation initiation factor 2-alpha kinase 4
LPSYDKLIRHYTSPQDKPAPVVAFALQISVDRIKLALANYHKSSLTALVTQKDGRSFGYWSRKRCDVYIVSHQAGYLQDRLEVAAYLWQNQISADMMYESSIQVAENYVDICASEGIL